jgi:hypothetical protein
MPWKALTTLQANGSVETGELFEQTVQITQTKESLVMRRVVLKLKKPTRNGEKEIGIFTPVPPSLATSAAIAELDRGRPSVENLFQTVTENYECEIQTLGYPKAALFSFCLAIIAYNILATVRAVLGSVHGVGKIEAGLSDYYMVDETQGTYRGMMIAIPSEHWRIFSQYSLDELASVLQHLARQVRLSSFLKQTRAPKKEKKPPYNDPRHPHVSTAKLLEAARSSP